MSAATHTEIQQAKADIEAHGYTVETHENGHLIVLDPVMICGTGPNAGKLIPNGFKRVAVRNMRDAIRFITERQ